MRAADGTFVYAVTSTGIYCRPSCPSRRPRADRVRFFDTTLEARQSGFRACKRCRPDTVGLAQPGIDAVRRASAYLATHADQTVTLGPPGARGIDERASSAAPLQGDRRAVAERIPVGGARRKVTDQPARRPRCDDGDLRSGLWIAEPRLRGGADRQGHVAVELPSRRRGHADRLLDDLDRRWPGAGGGDGDRRVLGEDRRQRNRACRRSAARVSVC